MEYWAHENQSLKEHLSNVAKLAGEFGKKFDAEKCAGFAGLFHDLGKYTVEYQDYLNKSIRGDKTHRGDVIHAFQGAKFILDNIGVSLFADILANPIAAHHGGLYDNITDGEKTLLKKTQNEIELHYKECKIAFETEFKSLPNFDFCQNELMNFCTNCDVQKLNVRFMLHLLTKAIYSCLIDADRCDSAGFVIENEIPDWNEFLNKLEVHLGTFNHSTELNKTREKISNECKKAGTKEQGIYSLSIPTGGGKTLSSLRFALEHAKKHNLEHIIYVIPYLSILDQNAKIINEILGEENILEHHSNLELPNDEKKENEHSLLTSRWDSPIIFTTMVQFLETVYSNKASKLRKFHNMAKSLFIFDEIQSLPIKCIHLFNDTVNFLYFFGKSTVLLCTATTPHLCNVERPVKMSKNQELISLSEEELKCFKRTNIKQSSKCVLELIKEQLNAGKSTLVILNTKTTAKSIFEQCKDLTCEKVFLTTDLCPAHRIDILEKLRNSLTNKKLSLCISTQLIEAGVDISFDTVIRSCAGMDSIVQAAGRCNRNGEHSEPQNVFIVDIEEENLDMLEEIKEGKDCTRRVFGENNNFDMSKYIDAYYKYYYEIGDIKDKMDYKIKNTSIYNLLDMNCLYFKNRPLSEGLPASFRMASENFSVIDKQQTGIIVPYGEANDLVKKFQKEFKPDEKYRILRKLQKYTVSVYSYKLTKLEENRAIRKINDDFYYLWDAYYDEQIGLLEEPKNNFLYS